MRVGPTGGEDEMSRLWEVLKHEVHEVLPAPMVLLIAFHIVILDKALILRGYGLPMPRRA